MPHILIVEDEPSIAESLEFVLRADSHTTHWLSLAGAALEYIQQQRVDLIILDVGLPDMTGFEACKQLRKFSEVPVMFLTARGAEVDRVVGLEIGADDYVVKPFSPREVAARVKAILKRIPSDTAGERLKTVAVSAAAPSPSAEFTLDNNAKAINYWGQTLVLTRFEFLLLSALIAQPGRVFSREQLLTAAGAAAEAGYERGIDGHIKSLRSKLRQIKPQAEPIKTQRGFGYCYQAAPIELSLCP
jgi:two-component system, OmpR family, catabolic regulation response regulator CreB